MSIKLSRRHAWRLCWCWLSNVAALLRLFAIITLVFQSLNFGWPVILDFFLRLPFTGFIRFKLRNLLVFLAMWLLLILCCLSCLLCHQYLFLFVERKLFRLAIRADFSKICRKLLLDGHVLYHFQIELTLVDLNWSCDFLFLSLSLVWNSRSSNLRSLWSIISFEAVILFLLFSHDTSHMTQNIILFVIVGDRLHLFLIIFLSRGIS